MFDSPKVRVLSLLCVSAVQSSFVFGSRLERRFSPWDTDLRPPWGTPLAGLGGAGAASGHGLGSVLLQPAAWSSLRGLEFSVESGLESRKESGDIVRLTFDDGISWYNFGPGEKSDTQPLYPSGAAGAGRSLGRDFSLGGGLALDLLKNGLQRTQRAESRLAELDETIGWGSHYRLVLGVGLGWERGKSRLALGLSWDAAHLGGLGTEIHPYNSSSTQYTILPGGRGGWTLGLQAALGRLGAGVSAWIPGMGRNNFSQLYALDFDFDQPYPAWTQAGLSYDFGFLRLVTDLRWIDVSPLLSRQPPNFFGLYPSAPFPVEYHNGQGLHFGVEVPSPFQPALSRAEGGEGREGIPAFLPRLFRLGFSSAPSWYGLNTAEIPGLDTQSGVIPTLSGWSGSMGLSGGSKLGWDLSIIRSEERFFHRSITRSAQLSLRASFF